MSRSARTLVLALLAAALHPSAAHAQLSGLAVHNSAVASGLALGAEVGFPNGDYGKGTAFGGRATLGFGPFGLGALVTSYKPKGGSSSTTVGGYGSLKVFGGPLIPLSATLQAGIEHGSPGSATITHVPVGVGIALKIPNPALAIKIAPRFDYLKIKDTGIDESQNNFGLSGGVDFSLLGGIGFGVAYDKVWADHGVSPAVLSAGVHYTFKIPGL
jgi:hypothetical protein